MVSNNDSHTRTLVLQPSASLSSLCLEAAVAGLSFDGQQHWRRATATLHICSAGMCSVRTP